MVASRQPDFVDIVAAISDTERKNRADSLVERGLTREVPGEIDGLVKVRIESTDTCDACGGISGGEGGKAVHHGSGRRVYALGGQGYV
ncbi:MAG: hypothetical protein WCI05_09280 [Myxococcales bacterium]